MKLVADIGSVALPLQNAKCNINPGLGHFEQCALAYASLLVNSHLHFAFRKSKATDPILLPKEFIEH